MQIKKGKRKEKTRIILLVLVFLVILFGAFIFYFYQSSNISGNVIGALSTPSIAASAKPTGSSTTLQPTALQGVGLMLSPCNTPDIQNYLQISGGECQTKWTWDESRRRQSRVDRLKMIFVPYILASGHTLTETLFGNTYTTHRYCRDVDGVNHLKAGCTIVSDSPTCSPASEVLNDKCYLDVMKVRDASGKYKNVLVSGVDEISCADYWEQGYENQCRDGVRNGWPEDCITACMGKYVEDCKNDKQKQLDEKTCITNAQSAVMGGTLKGECKQGDSPCGRGTAAYCDCTLPSSG